MPCLVHGSACPQQPLREPHHLVTVGARGSDYSAVPLCREMHKLLHDEGQLTGHRVNLWHEAWGLTVWYFTERKP